MGKFKLKNGKLIELLTVGKFAQTEEEFLYKYNYDYS